MSKSFVKDLIYKFILFECISISSSRFDILALLSFISTSCCVSCSQILIISFSIAFNWGELYPRKIKNEIIPFEIQDEPGRFYYRNAGETIRKGVEFSFSKKFKDVVIVKYLYSISDLRFVNYQTDQINNSGNFLPLNPKNINYVELIWNLNKKFSFKLFDMILLK